MKKRLIKWLGGYTREEMYEIAGSARDTEYYSAYVLLKEYVDQLYGRTADEWCKNVYEHILHVLKYNKPKTKIKYDSAKKHLTVDKGSMVRE